MSFYNSVYITSVDPINAANSRNLANFVNLMYFRIKPEVPLHGMSNGTVIAVGDVVKNEDYCNYSSQLSSFLLKDKNIESVLGANFRRKFPTIWRILGYYNKQKEFKIGNDLGYL